MKTVFSTYRRIRSERSRRGGAIVFVTLMVAALASFSLSMMVVSSSSHRERRASMEEMSARYVTEAGISHALFQINNGESGTIGSADDQTPFGAASYWVTETDLGGGIRTLVGSSINGASGSRIEVVVAETSGALFTYAAFGDESLTLSSNAQIDSYDSDAGSYASQAVNNDSGNTYANANGHVGSNGDIDMSQNAAVYGNAIPGEGSAVIPHGNATTVTGSTTPAYGEAEMDPIDVPDIDSLGPLLVGGGDTIYLGSGDHHFESLEVSGNGTLHVTGPARVVFDSLELLANADFVIDATNGPVDLYVTGDFILNSNTFMGSTDLDPMDLVVYLTSDNIIDPDVQIDLDQVVLDSNAKLYGTIYAPNSQIDIESNFELFGAVMSRILNIASNALIHFDEGLLEDDRWWDGTFEPICWREMAWSPVNQ